MAELVIGYPDETTTQRAFDISIKDWRELSRETG